MQLLIDTTQRDHLFLALMRDNKVVGKLEKIVAGVSEHLLPELQKLLKKHHVILTDLDLIAVNPGPGGFSSVRTGVATANALAYALGIPLAEWPSGKIRKIVLPKYNHLPHITRPRGSHPGGSLRRRPGDR